MKTAIDLLDRAIQLTNEHSLAKGALARDELGNAVPINSRKVHCFCTMGFLLRARFDLGVDDPIQREAEDPVRAILEKRTSSRLIAPWSDNPKTTIEDVRALFIEARGP